MKLKVFVGCVQRGRTLFCKNLHGPRGSLLDVFVQGGEGRQLAHCCRRMSRNFYSSAEIDIAIAVKHLYNMDHTFVLLVLREYHSGSYSDVLVLLAGACYSSIVR